MTNQQKNGIINYKKKRKEVKKMAHPKKNRKERPLWTPYYVRKTKTFKEHKENLEKKHKKRLVDDD